MQTFEEIGLRDELLRVLEDEDVAEPTALQAAVLPALRRGGNLVARASSGSGKTLAYTLGVLDRVAATTSEPVEGIRFLVLAATAADAERIARVIIPYATGLGFAVGVAGAPWGTAVSESAIVAAAPSDLMEAIRSSAIKLDQVEAVVIDGAATMSELGEWDPVDTLLDLVPRDAQRIVISARLSEPVEDLVERRVKRALRYPAEPAIADRRETPPVEGGIGYVIASDREKLRLLAGQLRGREPGTPPPVIFCRSDERAADLAEELTTRGFAVGAADDPEVDLAIAAAGVARAELLEEQTGEPGQTISYDVPPDADTLRARHAGDADAVVLVQPREVPHLREIARQVGLAPRSTPLPFGHPPSERALAAFREELRQAVREEDLTAQMLVLEPLLEEFSAVEIAAAASALLRSRRPQAAEPSAPATIRAGSDRSADAGPPPATWARLFVSVGSRDEIRPGDLLGALAGEAGIPGSSIGKIEIRDSFSIVEVQSDAADQVIRAVNGTTIKNRSVRVDYDRGGPGKRPPMRGGAVRRTGRRSP